PVQVVNVAPHAPPPLPRRPPPVPGAKLPPPMPPPRAKQPPPIILEAAPPPPVAPAPEQTMPALPPSDDDETASPSPVSAAPPVLDLENVEGLSDLPDDARDAFAAAAEIHHLRANDEAGSFALALVVEGTVDVAATIVDAAAARVGPGTVLRTRGTVGEGLPLRLICAGESATIATWRQDAIDGAFKSCPWVEEDLRVAADRTQALVGITMGPLADRLDPSLRQQVTDRLVVRVLAPGEVLVEAGHVVPGLMLVGVGGIEMLDGETFRGQLGPGEFLFASTILGGGAAPLTARASEEGAVILWADRKVAQELLVTCPPLLELFAGM
ncbi:MAG: putative type pilus assembly FimV-related transrane protein, partial [Myxococcaceae bacterium]|nr:putative type pilus assembly FimV-related transrane protein [Myxococcaceae bacterium]